MSEDAADLSDAWLRELELFPTPPWATRTLFEFVLPAIHGLRSMGAARIGSCWEPAAGLGHMSETIGEYCDVTIASDVADYPLDGGGRMSDRGLQIIDFLGDPSPIRADWIVTNPPFKRTENFVRRGLERASKGVALLQKQSFLAGGQRYRELYAETPPDLVAAFAERVPMCLGGYDPRASSDMDYAWFVWLTREGLEDAGDEWAQRREFAPRGWLQLLLIPPGRREAYFRESDLRLAEERRLPGWIANQKIRKLRRRIHAERDARIREERA